MVQLRMSTDSSPNSTRMETICDQKANLVDGALKVISKDERPKSSLDESNQESNLKLKRCKHGRIIVKDLSKKKPVQQGDRDEDPSKNYSSNNNNSRTKNNNLTEETAQTSQSTEIDLTAQTSGAKTPEETTSKTTPATDCNAIKSEIKSPIGVKLSERCDDGLRVADPQMRRRPSKSPSRHVRSSKVEGRSRTPLRRRQLSRSPSPKTPPPRTSRASPHRRKRSYSRSPRSRRDRSRSRSRSRSPRSSRRSPRRNHRRSPRRSKNSSNNRQSSRHSPRHRSPRRNRSRSRTRTRSKSPYRLSKLSNRETSKSPEGFRRDKTSRESGRERGLSRVFDKSPKELCERQNKDMTVVGKVLPFQQTLDAPAITSAAVAQDGLKSNSINHTNPHAIADNIHETAHPTASPHRSNTSMTISSNDSVSSDIYDPEGPILPISPGDSPPLSPINRAANDTISNNKFLHIEKDDDEMPSSAVELNSQEKYLQKLNRQERVVEEVKIALKPHYQKRAISKDQYKDVLRRAVPKICHSKNGEINPVKIRSLVDAYVKKMKK